MVLTTVLAVVWMFVVIIQALFWLYLWQLKEYHIGRFLDHFRTHKGKRLLVNPTMGAAWALLLVVVFGFWQAILPMLLFFYGARLALAAVRIIKRQFKYPVFTGKIAFLTLATVIAFAGLLWAIYSFAKTPLQFFGNLLLVDIFAAAVVSIVVLLFQPIFVVMRHRVLQKAAQKRSQYPDLLVIGITGSYGKTSTKEFLATILGAKFKVLATPEHKNSEIGIAQTILQDLKPEHEIFIVEMGSYRRGGIKLLCDIVRPSIGIVTGVNAQHLALFGNMENLLSAEGGRELLAHLPKDGKLFINGNNQHCLDLYKHAKIFKKVYATSRKYIMADVWAEHITASPIAIDFLVRTHGGQVGHMQVGVLGQHQAQNLLGAVAVARELGMTIEEITLAAKNITQKQGGMTAFEGVHGIRVVDASHSSNPDGVAADLEYLRTYQGKRVIVMPCLIELGATSAKTHVMLGKRVAQACDLAIITTKDKFEEIKRGAQVGNHAPQILFCDNAQEIFHKITTFCKSGDAVLLEGRVPTALLAMLQGK